MKIIEFRSDLRRHALVVHIARAVDWFPKPIVKILRLAAIRHLLFVVKLDLRNEKPCKAASIIVQTLFVIGNLDRQINMSVAKTALYRLGRSNFDNRFGNWCVAVTRTIVPRRDFRE